MSRLIANGEGISLGFISFLVVALRRARKLARYVWGLAAVLDLGYGGYGPRGGGEKGGRRRGEGGGGKKESERRRGHQWLSE